MQPLILLATVVHFLGSVQVPDPRPAASHLVGKLSPNRKRPFWRHLVSREAFQLRENTFRWERNRPCHSFWTFEGSPSFFSSSFSPLPRFAKISPLHNTPHSHFPPDAFSKGKTFPHIPKVAPLRVSGRLQGCFGKGNDSRVLNRGLARLLFERDSLLISLPLTCDKNSPRTHTWEKPSWTYSLSITLSFPFSHCLSLIPFLSLPLSHSLFLIPLFSHSLSPMLLLFYFI